MNWKNLTYYETLKLEWIMIGDKIDGVRIEYRIKNEKGVVNEGGVTHIEYLSQEDVPNKISELLEKFDIEWMMIDRYHRRVYDRVETKRRELYQQSSDQDRLKKRISVVRFDAFNYDRNETENMPDEKLLDVAKSDTLGCIVHDSLSDYQKDYNNGEIDWSDNYMKFCVRPFQPMTPDELRETFDNIKQVYQKDGICMSELLVALPADCMSFEQAALLYINAMNWANGDKYFVKHPDEVIRHIDLPLESK